MDRGDGLQYLADTEGTVQTSTGGLLQGQSVRARPWFFNALKESYSGDLHDALLILIVNQDNKAIHPISMTDSVELSAPLTTQKPFLISRWSDGIE